MAEDVADMAAVENDDPYKYGWWGIYCQTDFPDECYVSYDPWLFGSVLLGLMLFLALLALVATLFYIVCYRIKDKRIVEEIPTGPCRPALRTCGPCQPRMTSSCGGGRCDLPSKSTFILQPSRICI